MSLKKKMIYKRKDGRYEGRYLYGYKEDGTPNYRSIYANTKDKAVQKLDYELKKKSDEGDLFILDKNYFGYDILRWLKSVKIRCKKTTYSNYQYTVNARIIPKFAKLKKKLITSEMIDNYTTELLNEGLLPKTVKDIIIILQQILKFASINISISIPKVPKTEIQILKKEEQSKLEKKLLENLDLVKFGIYLSLYTGLRIGELCALKWENIDIENKKIKINKTITRIKNPDSSQKKKTIILIDEPKSLSSIREIPIPDFIVPILKKFQKNIVTSNFLITGEDAFMETRTYFNHYKKFLQSLNLSCYNFHALRHTFATRCVENGCDPKTLSEILGHSSVKITLERYVHPNYENKVKLMNKLKPMFF